MKKIELVEIRQVNDALAEMVALFRVELRSYKGIASKPNVEDGREEMKEYLLAGFPVFAATVHGEFQQRNIPSKDNTEKILMCLRIFQHFIKQKTVRKV